MTDRPRMACSRVIVPATLAALLAAAPLGAQGPRPVTSGVAQVQLSATMLPAAHLQGSSQMVGWRRSASGQEGVATLAVLPNAPYRLVVYRVDQQTAAVGQASRRVWVASGDSTLQEVRSGTPVVIRGSGATQTTEQRVTLRVRVGLGEATSPVPSEVPLRYEIQVEPTL
jgi:hypothetical protein